MGQRVVTIPYTPRPLQLAFHNRTQRWSIDVDHRRFGKTVMAVNDLLRDALRSKKERARYAYLAPFYTQAKDLAWDYLKHYSSVIPGHRVNESELRVDYPNGSRIKLYGGDKPDRLRGLYLDGCVLDEYGQMSPRLFPEVIRPALSDREGWAAFIGTPKGHNAFFELYEEFKDDPEWFVRVLKASQTDYVKPGELELARKMMSDEMYEQEYECSWTAAIIGAYYGKLMEQISGHMLEELNPDPGVPVETWWDLGIGDPCAIWFCQRIGPEMRMIDYYENFGEPLSHYVNVLVERSKARGYKLGTAVLPHDARQRMLDSGKTRKETLESLGLDCEIVRDHRIDDGIEAARRVIPNCWFDKVRCKPGIDALRMYRADYDEKNQVLRPRPVHDWASHGADAFRYGAIHEPMAHEWAPIQYDNRGIV